MATAIALQKLGHDVIFSSARARFGRIGADGNLTPNAVHALVGLGIGDTLRKTAARPGIPDQPDLGHRRRDLGAATR